MVLDLFDTLLDVKFTCEAIGAYSLLCEPSQLIVQIEKYSEKKGENEVVSITVNGNTIRSFSGFANRFITKDSVCIDFSDQDEYALVLETKYKLSYIWTNRDGTPWYHRNYVELKGEYGNSILITSLSGYEKTSIPLFRIDFRMVFPIVPYLIPRNVEWKSSSLFEPGWMNPSFVDDHWTSITLPTKLNSSSYFIRRHFEVMLGSIASYTISIVYQYGIIVYMDGKEVIRDNLVQTYK